LIPSLIFIQLHDNNEFYSQNFLSSSVLKKGSFIHFCHYFLRIDEYGNIELYRDITNILGGFRWFELEEDKKQ
jgi:hypothetical protein